MTPEEGQCRLLGGFLAHVPPLLNVAQMINEAHSSGLLLIN